VWTGTLKEDWKVGGKLLIQTSNKKVIVFFLVLFIVNDVLKELVSFVSYELTYF
jgi:hypothetical protein